ncbi:MATE family efflux transporter [Methylobacterium sp. JK268]
MTAASSGAADLGAPDLRRLVVRLALPTVIGLSANAAHHAANAVFVGMIGVEALAAILVALPIVALLAAFGEGLGAGAATAIGRDLGAGAPARAGATASTVVALALLGGLVLGAGTALAREPLLVLFGAPADTLPLAGRYLAIIALGAPLALLQIVFDFIAIGQGRTRFSMGTLVGGFALNAVLDPVLIFGCGLGTDGAALATVLSEAAVVGVYLVWFARRCGDVPVAPRRVRWRRAVLAPVLTVGLPTTAASMLTGIAFAILYRAAGTQGGEAGIAAVGVALRVLTLGTLPVLGFTLGAQPVMSFAWGAGNRERVAAACRLTAAVTTGFCVAYAGLVAAAARPIAGLFIADPATHDLAAQALLAAHLAFPFAGLRAVVLALLEVVGRLGPVALLALAQNGYLLIGALILLPPRLGFAGVLASLWVSGGLATVVALALALPLWAARRDRAPRPLHSPMPNPERTAP